MSTEYVTLPVPSLSFFSHFLFLFFFRTEFNGASCKIRNQASQALIAIHYFCKQSVMYENHKIDDISISLFWHFLKFGELQVPLVTIAFEGMTFIWTNHVLRQIPCHTFSKKISSGSTIVDKQDDNVHKMRVFKG